MKGGLRIFAVLTAMYVVAYFFRVSAAVAADAISGDLGLTPAQLGRVSAALFFAFALTQLPLGPLLDRYGSRRIIFILGLVAAVGSWRLATADGYADALLGRALIGAGTACVLMGSLKVYTAWFSPRQFATLSGLQVAIGNSGNLLATVPLAWMIGAFGWRGTFLGCALLTAVMAGLVLLLVRDAPQRQESSRPPGSFRAGWRALLRIRSFWGLALLAFFWYGGYMAVQGLWGGPYLIDVLGLDREAAARLLLLTAAGFICGCPLAGRLSDRVLRSRKKVLIVGQGGLLVILALFLGPLEHLPVAARPLVFFALGLFVSTGPVLYAQVKELVLPQFAATAMTTVNFFVVLGAAVLQQAMGRLLEWGLAAGASPGADAFHRAFALPVGGLAVAWLVYLGCRDTHPHG
jgi:predicted MFS family arabinose efflux permease